MPAAGIGAGAVRAAERPVTTIRVVAYAVVLFSTVSVLIFTQPQSFNSADNAGTAEVMDSRAITSRTTLGPGTKNSNKRSVGVQSDVLSVGPLRIPFAQRAFI